MKHVVAPKPSWATCCAEPHASEVGALRDHLEHREREIIRLRDQAMVLARDEQQRDRDVYAAAWRDAWDRALEAAHGQIVSRAPYGALGQLIDLAMSAAEQVRPDLADQLSFFAQHIRQQVETGDTSPGLVGEAARLRAAVYEQGQRLHTQFSTTDGSGDRCSCPGCELLRTVELHQLEVADA